MSTYDYIGCSFDVSQSERCGTSDSKNSLARADRYDPQGPTTELIRPVNAITQVVIGLTGNADCAVASGVPNEVQQPVITRSDQVAI